jgi:hypothetical protein
LYAVAFSEEVKVPPRWDCFPLLVAPHVTDGDCAVYRASLLHRIMKRE